MRQFINYLAIGFFTVIIFSCSSGKKSYEKGNYYSAVIQSVDRLRKNPDHKKSMETLSEAYPLAINYYEGIVRNVQQSNDRFKNGKVYDAYSALNHMYDEINRSPGALSVIPNPRSYFSELTLYRERAAEERYNAGMQALNLGSRESAKEAYFHFQEAKKYLATYKDVDIKIDEAHWAATLKVLVDQVPVPTWQYQLSVQFFQEQLNEYLFHYNGNEFVRFFGVNDENIKDPDQILIVQFDDFVVGQTNNFQYTREVTKDSVVVGQVKLENGESANVYGTVKATISEFKRELISKGLVSMRVLDARSNQIIVHDKFPGQFTWTSIWGNFNGDERALDKADLAICANKPADPPPPQDLFVEFTRPIYSQITSKVNGYYQRY